MGNKTNLLPLLTPCCTTPLIFGFQSHSHETTVLFVFAHKHFCQIFSSFSRQSSILPTYKRKSRVMVALSSANFRKHVSLPYILAMPRSLPLLLPPYLQYLSRTCGFTYDLWLYPPPPPFFRESAQKSYPDSPPPPLDRCITLSWSFSEH